MKQIRSISLFIIIVLFHSCTTGDEDQELTNSEIMPIEVFEIENSSSGSKTISLPNPK